MSSTYEVGPELTEPIATFIHIGRTASGIIIVNNPDPSDEQHCIEYAARIRGEIQPLPDDTSDIDISAINAFREEMGAPDKHIRFLSESDYKQATLQIKDASHAQGVYAPRIGIPLVRRHTELEALNSPGITESFGIHEIAHSSHVDAPVRIEQTKTGKWIFKKVKAEATETRSGFLIGLPFGTGPARGRLLEEGYAEYERGLYVQQHDLIGAFTSGAPGYAGAKTSIIPLQYRYKALGEDGEPFLTFGPGAVPAAILETLIKHEPEILPILRESRRGVKGMREFPQRVNSLIPGLYSKLVHMDEGSMAKLLRTTIKQLS